jgi:uncharacterized protein (TIGR02145 family)
MKFFKLKKINIRRLGISGVIFLLIVVSFLNGLISANASVSQSVLGIAKGGTNANSVESAQINLGRTDTISSNSTDDQLPSAKAVYSYIKYIFGNLSADNINFSSTVTNWTGGNLIYKDSRLNTTAANNKIIVGDKACTTSGQGYTSDSAAGDGIPQVGCVLPSLAEGHHDVKISVDGGANYSIYAGAVNYKQTPALPGCDTTSMQTFGADATACKAIMQQGQVIVLNDTRNNQKYRVKKMPDGNVWMIDSLKLGSTTGTTVLTPADTNISSDYTLPKISNSTANSDPSGTTYCSSTGLVHTHNPGNTTACGYLYNWATAIAGTSSNSGYSISAKGWGLHPNSDTKSAYELNSKMLAVAANSNSNRNPVYSTTGYKNFGEGGSGLPAAWLGVYSGYFDSSGGFDYQGSYGYYWSSTENYSGSSYARDLYFNSSNFSTQNGSLQTYGFSIRSVL